METRRSGGSILLVGNIGAGRPGWCGCDVAAKRYTSPLRAAKTDCTVLRKIEYVNFSFLGP
jgi:hypothetical protein